MRRTSRAPRSAVGTVTALVLGLTLVSACSDPGTDGAGVTAYEGARVIPGNDGAVIEDAVFLVEDGRFTAVGARADVDVPGGATRVDLTGRTVIPALVNAHIHLSSVREERIDQLQHMAYYGAGTVASLGLDDGTIGYDMRDEIVPDGARSVTAGRGITSPEPGRSEVPYWVTTEEEARAAVRELAEQGADLVKIWVDDRNGQYERLPPELYGPVIDEAHQHDLQVAAHIFRLEDAKGLLRAGLDAFAHGIRDQDIDDELLALWMERPDVVLIPNLPGPGVPVDLSWMSGTVPAAELADMQAGETERPAQQASFAIQARNLDRINEAGLPVAFGTDGSSAWAVHQEMEDMVRSGMTPAEVITAATGTSAAFLGIDEVGAVAAGKSADFVVLEADPLTDITNTRRITDVYLRGAAIDREAISARFLGGAGE